MKYENIKPSNFAKVVCAIFASGMIFLLGACSSSVTRQTADWGYAKGAISIELKAEKSLNVFDGYSHALSVAIIQVSSPTKLMQILQTPNGIVTVIDNNKPLEGQTVFKRISLQPGENKKLLLDRAKGTEYVYLVFGYASEIVSKSDYLIPIPLDETPQPLDIKVVLGATYVSSINYTK